MAVLHSLAGQWSLSEADRRMRRLMSWLIWLAMAFGAGLAWAWMYWGLRLALLPMIVAVGFAMLGLLRLMDKPLRALAKERVKYLRGA